MERVADAEADPERRERHHEPGTELAEMLDELRGLTVV
jgi:hypothetical protein